MEKRYYDRKSPRAEFYDYCDGDFFVTICTREKEHSFGKISNGEMIYTPIGRYCAEQIPELPSHYPYAEVMVYQVMPNHLHAIIRLKPETVTEKSIPQTRTLLGIVIGGLKSAITRFARRNHEEFGWQKRFHDHRIRGTRDGTAIWEYIESNVQKWQDDCFNKYDR